MKTQNKLLLMATASLLVFGSAAQAQDAPAPAADAPVETAETISDSDAQLEFLKAQVDSLQAQIESLTAKVSKAEPSWKGAPNWLDKDAGWSFKPKGFAQFDAGYVSTPGPKLNGTVGGTNYNNLGWNMRTRRLVFGAEGSMPGGFGYKVEFNFAQSTVDYEDITLSWQGKGPIQLTVGHMYPLSSLETMTSSRLGSFMERAGFTEAFNYNRRLGLMAAYVDPADKLYLAAGVWGQEINDSTNFSRTAWQGSARAVYSPSWGSTRLHMGVNAQYRKAPRDAQNMRYRVRPFSQTTDQRFIDTNTIAADGDTTLGVEFAAIHGPFHYAAEAQKVWVRGYAPGTTFGPNNAAGGSFYNDDVSFWGGYAELGFFLTGETRGYKGAKWDRTKVLKPVGQGGFGALQLNARLDYVNLNDAAGGTGPAPVAPVYVNGGRQTGYQLSLIWNPIDYIRFLAQYSRAHVNGGPRAATIDPTGPTFVLDKSYNVDQFGVRAQVEF